MTAPLRRALSAFLAAAILSAVAWAAPAATDADRLKTAKALFFDHRYDQARGEWQALLAQSKGPQADAAAYWMARCTEALGDQERALAEFGAFLARRPADTALVEEARTSRVGLAAKLYRAGKRQHAALLKDALADPSRTVRYYAALQAADLDADMGRAAAPVLRQIIAEEKDADLVDRARLKLLRIDPAAASASAGRITGRVEAGPRPGPTRWLRVRVYEKGKAEPEVSLNLPLALAEIAFKSLPDEAKADLRKQGFEADTFWKSLQKLGPAEIVTVQGEDGGRVQIWIE